MDSQINAPFDCWYGLNTKQKSSDQNLNVTNILYFSTFYQLTSILKSKISAMVNSVKKKAVLII